MKNQLLATLCMVTSFFSFTNQVVVQQTNKAEFLTYLNNIQVVVEKELQELSHEEKILEQKFPDYNVSKKVLNKLFDTPQFIHYDQSAKIEKLIFGLLCYKIRSLENLTFTPKNPWHIPTNDFFTFFLWNASKEDEQLFSDLSAELDIDFNRNPNANSFTEKNEESMRHLMKTLVEKYCHKKDTRTLEEKMGAILGSYESLELSTIINYTKILTVLLQDIKNKIKEIETQE